MAALDVGLLAIVTTVYLGATFVAVGLTFQRTGAFVPWIRWTPVVAGGAGTIIGVLMYLDVATVAAFYGFRAVTLATFGIVVDLRRAAAAPTTSVAASGAAPA